MTRKILDNIAGSRSIIGMAHMGVIRIYRDTGSVPPAAKTGMPAALGQQE